MIWMLEPIDRQEKPWVPWFDKMFEIVVKADTEEEARQIAADASGDEGPDAWLDDKLSNCEEVDLNYENGVICRDVSWA